MAGVQQLQQPPLPPFSLYSCGTMHHHPILHHLQKAEGQPCGTIPEETLLCASRGEESVWCPAWESSGILGSYGSNQKTFLYICKANQPNLVSISRLPLNFMFWLYRTGSYTWQVCIFPFICGSPCPAIDRERYQGQISHFITSVPDYITRVSKYPLGLNIFKGSLCS